MSTDSHCLHVPHLEDKQCLITAKKKILAKTNDSTDARGLQFAWQHAGCRLLCLFRWLSHLILIAILCMFLLRHGLTWILNKQIKQYRPEHSWSSGTIRVFVLCLSAFVLVMLFSSPPISLQFRLQCLHSIALCMWTQKSDYAATPPPLPSPPPTPLFFFFFYSLTSACPLTETLTSQVARCASPQCFIQQV